jgi:hypothetical protein
MLLLILLWSARVCTSYSPHGNLGVEISVEFLIMLTNIDAHSPISRFLKERNVIEAGVDTLMFA